MIVAILMTVKLCTFADIFDIIIDHNLKAKEPLSILVGGFSLRCHLTYVNRGWRK